MALFRRKRQAKTGSPGNDVDPKDRVVLDQLAKRGADLTKPRHVRYYLYFSDAESARAAATEAGERGFTAKLREPIPEYPDSWSLECELHDAILDMAAVRANADFFEGVADRHDGEYDGWEAAVH